MTNNINKTILSWTSHPLLDFPLNSILLMLFIFLIGMGLWKIAVDFWEMPLFYYLGMTIFLFSLASYFIPTRYEFHEEKIVVYYWIIRIEKKYEMYKCFYSDKKGVMLSTFVMPRRLDPFRGLSIRYSKKQDEKKELLSLLERKIGKQY